MGSLSNSQRYVPTPNQIWITPQNYTFPINNTKARVHVYNTIWHTTAYKMYVHLVQVYAVKKTNTAISSFSAISGHVF